MCTGIAHLQLRNVSRKAFSERLDAAGILGKMRLRKDDDDNGNNGDDALLTTTTAMAKWQQR